MGTGGWKCAWAATLALTVAACSNYDLPDLCNPESGGSRVGFYSTGDCVGLDSPAFLGHEWLMALGNQDPLLLDPPHSATGIFNKDQLGILVDGNRHTDYPLELLVHLDNGVSAYLEALLAYQEEPDNQAPHSLLRADNYTLDAWRETLCVIRNKTRDGVARYFDEPEAGLTIIGSASHTFQDSYATAHTVRYDPGYDPEVGPACSYHTTDWCLCKLKAYVTRDADNHFDEPNSDPDAPDYGQSIEFHEREDYQASPGRAVAGDAVFRDDRNCHEPGSSDKAWDCLADNAKQAVIGTHAYLALVKDLLEHHPDGAEIDQRLHDLLLEHLRLCRPQTWDPASCPEPE